MESEDGLITLETDKASFDVPAAEAGTVESLSVAVGDRVSTGSVIGKLTPRSAKGESIEPAEPSEPAGDTNVMAAQPASESGAGGEQLLVVPALGDFSDVEVIEVHAAVGQEIAVDDPLLTLETDKAAMDVPAVFAGTVKEMFVAVGDKVNEGTSIGLLDVASAAPPEESSRAPDRPAAASPQEPEVAAESQSAVAAVSSPKKDELPPINEVGFARSHASPSVRKFARELGVDLASVKGSGPKSRILRDDVKAFVKSVVSGKMAPAGAAGLPETPRIDFTKFGEIELKELTRIQKISGPRLQASWVNLPHVTQHDLADITELENRRQQLKGPARERGIALTPLAFIMKAVVAALQEFPKANSSLSDDGANLVYKKYCHLGFAADTDQGLMVPVIRNADQKDIYELAQELGELSALAREGKLKAEQLQGATFTVSSLGGIGGTAFTPIVNAPEVAILGVSRSSMQPVWDGSKFEPRLMLPLSLSYDHRVIDGAQAVRFTTFLGQQLGDVDTLLQAIP